MKRSHTRIASVSVGPTEELRQQRCGSERGSIAKFTGPVAKFSGLNNPWIPNILTEHLMNEMVDSTWSRLV
jgi:hypothetical protein